MFAGLWRWSPAALVGSMTVVERAVTVVWRRRGAARLGLGLGGR